MHVSKNTNGFKKISCFRLFKHVVILMHFSKLHQRLVNDEHLYNYLLAFISHPGMYHTFLFCSGTKDGGALGPFNNCTSILGPTLEPTLLYTFG